MSSDEEETDNRNDNPLGLPVYRPVDHADQFDPLAYLRDFYTNVSSRCNEFAMIMVLHSLPVVVARLPDRQNFQLLDVGSGPTIHMAVLFRHKASEIYLSDFSDRNRDVLRQWLEGCSPFDWTHVLTKIKEQEITKELPKEMEALTRSKVKGILPCNVFDDKVVATTTNLGKFDIVTTTYCVEYASSNADDYHRAIQNVVSLVKPGGYLLMGGIIGASWYQFDKKRFSSHSLKEEEMFQAIEDAGIERSSVIHYKFESVFLILGKKKGEDDPGVANEQV